MVTSIGTEVATLGLVGQCIREIVDGRSNWRVDLAVYPLTRIAGTRCRRRPPRSRIRPGGYATGLARFTFSYTVPLGQPIRPAW